MKARVKATGEIVEVSQGIYSPYQYVDDNGTIYTKEHLEILQKDSGVIFIDPTLDYWTRLEHQYAGMAMQEILRGCGDYYELTKLASCAHEHRAESIAEVSRIYAHALVEKYKKEE